MNIGFDFDGIIVNYPPFLPKQIINNFYRKNKKSLYHASPTFVIKELKHLSHHPLLRQPLKNNLQIIQSLNENPELQLFIISGRYSFLKKRTADWIAKYNLNTIFDGIYFNDKDEQPHIFKERLIKKLRIEKYIDDDVITLSYLANKLPDVKFFWYNFDHSPFEESLPKNISVISSIKKLQYI